MPFFRRIILLYHIEPQSNPGRGLPREAWILPPVILLLLGNSWNINADNKIVKKPAACYKGNMIRFIHHKTMGLYRQNTALSINGLVFL